MKRYVMQGIEFDELPSEWGNTNPITERWWLAHGGTIEEVDDGFEEGIKYDVATIKEIFEADNREWYYLQKALDDVGVLGDFENATVVNTNLQDIRDLIEQVHERFVHRWTLSHVLHLNWKDDEAREQAEKVWADKVERVRCYGQRVEYEGE